MNKLLLTTALVVASVSSAYAAAPSKTVTTMEKKVTERTTMPASNIMVSLGGELTTEAFYNSQKNRFDTVDYTDPNSNKIHKFAITNDTRLHFKVDGNSHGMKYGGKVVLNADTSSSKFAPAADAANNRVGYQTMAYIESKMGRLEGGSTTGVYEAMKVNGATHAAATGGIDGDTRYIFNQQFANGTSTYKAAATAPVTPAATLVSRGQFVTAPSLPTNYDNYTVANAAKVSIMAPYFNNLPKLGLTYIPDTEQHGTVSNFHNVARNQFGTVGTIPANLRTSGYKNVFQGGLHYTGKFNNKSSFKFAALGELGKAKDVRLSDTVIGKRHKLRAWEIGASLMMNGFTLGGSYGDWGKSGLFKETATTVAATTTNRAVGGKKTTKYWTAGFGYDYRNLNASLTYMHSTAGGFARNLFANNSYDAGKGKYNIYSAGLDYKLAPGFKPFAEYSHYTMKDKNESVAGATKNNGNVFILGTNLLF